MTSSGCWRSAKRIRRHVRARTYRIVDPDATALEALCLVGADYGPPVRLAGLEASGSLAPFPGLVIALADVFAD